MQGASLGLQCGRTCWRGRVWCKSRTPSATTTSSTRCAHTNALPARLLWRTSAGFLPAVTGATTCWGLLATPWPTSLQAASRLTRRSHVQLCDGASSAERKAWFLEPAQKFRYLNQSSCFSLPRVDNAAEYQVAPRPLQSGCKRLFPGSVTHMPWEVWKSDQALVSPCLSVACPVKADPCVQCSLYVHALCSMCSCVSLQGAGAPQPAAPSGAGSADCVARLMRRVVCCSTRGER